MNEAKMQLFRAKPRQVLRFLFAFLTVAIVITKYADISHFFIIFLFQFRLNKNIAFLRAIFSVK